MLRKKAWLMASLVTATMVAAVVGIGASFGNFGFAGTEDDATVPALAAADGSAATEDDDDEYEDDEGEYDDDRYEHEYDDDRYEQEGVADLGARFEHEDDDERDDDDAHDRSYESREAEDD